LGTLLCAVGIGIWPCASVVHTATRRVPIHVVKLREPDFADVAALRLCQPNKRGICWPQHAGVCGASSTFRGASVAIRFFQMAAN
jgi:hypothetical protein